MRPDSDSTNHGSETRSPRFSLVIPAYNEEKYLPLLLDSVDQARARYRGGTEHIEVIVDFLLKLKYLDKKRQQRLIRLPKVKAVTSARKFDRFGDWHYPGLMLRGVFHMLFPKYSMKKFTQKYWYNEW